MRTIFFKWNTYGFLSVAGILFLSCMSLSAQIQVFPVSDSLLKAKTAGIIYNLPSTMAVIDIKLKKTIRERGVYAEYARGFLGLDNIIFENAVRYEISDVKVTTRPEPDLKQYFLAEHHPCLVFGKRARLEFTAEGYLKSLNTRNHEHQQSAPQTIVPAGKHVDEQVNKLAFEIPNYTINPTILKIEQPATEQLDSNGNVIPRKPVSRTEIDEKTQAAKAAAEALAKIKDSRQNLLSGYQEVDYESGTMQFMEDRLRTMEAGWLKMFLGTASESEKLIEMTWLPSRTDSSAIVIGYFSEKSGITDKPQAGSKPLLFRLSFEKIMPEWKEEPGSKKKVKHGLAYRIPAKVPYTITLGDKTLFSGEILIPQLGQVAYLPLKVKQAEFYPNTGGLKTLNTR